MQVFSRANIDAQRSTTRSMPAPNMTADAAITLTNAIEFGLDALGIGEFAIPKSVWGGAGETEFNPNDRIGRVKLGDLRAGFAADVC